MTTKTALIKFFGCNKTHIIELDWTRESWLQMNELFELDDCPEDKCYLMKKIGELSLQSFLAYVGQDINEARKKHPILNRRFEYASKSNKPQAYGIGTDIGIGKLENFYKRLEAGEKIERIVLEVLEHS